MQNNQIQDEEQCDEGKEKPRNAESCRIQPKPCLDIHVRTGGFQKIEERTWNLTRTRRQGKSRPSTPNN